SSRSTSAYDRKSCSERCETYMRRAPPSSAGEADRDQQVAVVGQVLAVERLLPGELDRLDGVREAQADEVRAERSLAVEEERRVERDRDVLTHEQRLERLRRLSVVALTGVEHHRAVAEGEAD